MRSSTGAILDRSFAKVSTGSRGVDSRPARGARRTRVLHVIQNLNYGGMERLLADIVQQVDPQRFESHVLVLQYLGRFAQGLDDVATLHVAEPMGRLSMLRPEALTRQIRGIAPDVVHSHSGVWFKASAAARAAGVPLVIHTEHGRQSPDPWRARVVDGLASRRTDVAVAVSEPVAQALRSDVIRGACRVEVIVNGTDTERFRPRPRPGRLRSELGVGPAIPLIGSIGRLESIKGFDVMLEAFARLPNGAGGSPDAALVIVGDGSERARLSELVEALGLGNRVHLLGWRDDTSELLSEFDLFTMSSHSEGTSVSLLEAMSSGLCPVVTDVGGNAVVLGEELAHRLVPSKDPAALARAWQQALSDPGTREADGSRARERICAHFSCGAMVRAYERLYSGAAREAERGEAERTGAALGQGVSSASASEI